MSFLAPLFLVLGAAAAVPLLIHLLRRRIGTRIEFPAARYLARAEREHSRRLRLRNLLLMLLRVAAVLLIALAAARPVGRVGGAGHAPAAVAIVLDNSLSTSAVVDGVPVLDDLRSRARELVARAGPADRLWLVTADGQVRGGTAATVLEALDAVEPLARAGDPPAALARGAALTASAGLPERSVALLTDAQASTWRGASARAETRVLIYRPDAPPPANRAVVRAEARPARWTPRGAVEASILAEDSTTYRIALTPPGGAARTLARGSVAGAQGSGPYVPVSVSAAPQERGWVAGSVEIEPDELRADDVRHFAVWIGTAPAVDVHERSGAFVRTAVEALATAGRVTRGDAISIVPAEALADLPALVLAPSDPVRAGAANRALERAGIPWRFGAVRRAETDVRGGRWTVTTGSAGAITVTERYALLYRGPGATDTLARAGAEPWIVAGDGYVLVGSPLDPAATTLPVRAAFVPWLADVLTQRLAGARGGIIHAVPGDSIALGPLADALELPDGTRVPMAGMSRIPERPGVHFLLRGGERVGALVVDAEPHESLLDRLDDAALSGTLDAPEVRVLRAGSRFAAAPFESAVRRPLMLPFLAAALLVLVGEALVVRGGFRRGGAEPAA